MHYLADLFLNQKQFPSTPEEKQALRTFRSATLQAAQYLCWYMVPDTHFNTAFQHQMYLSIMSKQRSSMEPGK